MKTPRLLTLASALALLAPGLASANPFAEELSSLNKDIQKALPTVDEPLKAIFTATIEAEFHAAQAAHEAMLAASNKKTKDKAAAQKASDEAKAAHEKTKADAQAATTALLAKLAPFLSSDSLDPKLVRAGLIAHATPDALSAFATQGKDHEAALTKLMGDSALMKQMLVAGGAKFGKYGEAMRIYTAIQSASPNARDGFLQTLALATALEHAEPVIQRNPADATDAPATVDPVKRYQHYEKVFLDGELDPDFKNLTVWELRMAVDCDAPDHILAWGREMLRNYRPDHMVTTNPGWRYTKLVKTDVLYGSKDQQFDLSSNQQYQNILMNGGVCGRRAFFGRFLLCSFGIPTWGVTQRAHAAIGRWTPNGWVTNLGAGFQWSWWDKDESKRSGNDFLLETQARKAGDGYLPVLRAQWISQVLGETPYNDRAGTLGGYWSNVAHRQSRAIATALQAKDLGAIGEELGESNESKSPDFIEKVDLTSEEKKVTIAADGTITIPAVAFTTSAEKPVSFFPMAAPCGAKRLHCSRDMKAEQSFEYIFDAPAAGSYQLTLHVVTVQANQVLALAANGASATTEIKLPYTLGHFQDTAPATVDLTAGRNTLRFTRPAGSRGLTIDHLTLRKP